MSNNGTDVTVGPVVLSFPHLFVPQKMEKSNEEKYSVMLVMDPKTKEGKKCIQLLEDAVEAAEKKFASKLEGVSLKKQRRPLQEGVDVRPKDPYFKGKIVMNASNSTQPEVIDADGNPITKANAKDVYPGIIAYVHINMFGYNKNGGVGIAASLQNVMKYEDGDRLDNRVSAKEAFKGVIFKDDDDDEEDRPRSKRRRDDDDEEEDRPRKKSRRSDDDDDEEDRPRKKSRRVDDDDEEDRPRSKRRRDDDDDDDEKPARKGKSKYD